MPTSKTLADFNRSMALRRLGMLAPVRFSAEERSNFMSQVANARMPGDFHGGRPRVVECNGTRGCRCVNCRKAKGFAPYNKPIPSAPPAPPE